MFERIGNGFEVLEDRTLLAASVTASLSNGTLTITGDGSAANDITVTGDGTDGDIEITVNGEALQVIGGTAVSSTDGTFTGVTSIVLTGGGGNDSLSLSDLTIAGNLSVTGGTGIDHVSLFSNAVDSSIGGSVSINGGAQTGDAIDVYQLQASHLSIGGSLNLSGASHESIHAAYGAISIADNVVLSVDADTEGYGKISVDGSGLITVGKNVTIKGNGGNDMLGITTHASSYGYGTHHAHDSLEIGGNVTIQARSGDNHIGIAAYGTVADHGITGDVGYGENSANITIHGKVNLHGGTGNDVLGVFAKGSAIQIDGSLVETDLAGNDQLGAVAYGSYGSLTIADNLQIRSRFGSDQLLAYGVTVHGRANLNGGMGADSIDFDKNTVTQWASLQGHNGDDTIAAVGNTTQQNLKVSGGTGTDSAFTDSNTAKQTLNLGVETTLTSDPFATQTTITSFF